jgi:putative ABC transport system permease protein
MKYLFVKMRRDLLQMWTQFLSVFLMALIGVAIYVGMEGTWFGLKTAVNDYYKNTDLASAWVYGMNITEADADDIKKLDGVTDVSLSMSARVIMKADDEPSIKLIATDNNSISKPVTIDGEEFDAHSDGIWVDKDFAYKRDIKVNDTITLSYGKANKDFNVKGIILSPEYVYYTGSATTFMPDHNKYGYAMIGTSNAEKFLGKIINNEVKIMLSDNADTNNVKKESEEILSDRYIGFSDRDTHLSVSNPIQKTKQIMKMSILFCTVFILLALLTMQTTMTRLVQNQRIQIGTMKALGFHNSQIKLHYSLYGLTVGLLGGIIALILSPKLITPVLINTFTNLYSLPECSAKLTPFSYIVVLIVALSCTLSALFACQKSLRGMPAETLRGAVPKGGKRILAEKIKFFWSRISFGWKWSMRDIARSKIKTIMGIIGVLGCMMLLIASLGMQNSLDYANNYVYKTQYTYKTKAVFQPYTTAENRDEIQNLVDASQWLQEISIEVKNDDKVKTGFVSIVGDGNFVSIEDMNHNSVKFPQDGIFVTRKIAEQLNLKAGDTMTFRVMGEKSDISVKIDKIITAPSPQGIFMSQAQWEKLGKTFNPSSILIGDYISKNDIENLSYIQEVASIDSQLEGVEQITESVRIVFLLLKTAAVLLGVVILYNLGILSYTERVREYATLKVLGFYQKEIRSFALRENLIITIIGWLCGIPVGLTFLGAYVNIVSMDSFDWVPKITPLSMIIATVITVGCSVGVSLLLSGKVKKINMVEALKSID